MTGGAGAARDVDVRGGDAAIAGDDRGLGVTESTTIAPQPFTTTLPLPVTFRAPLPEGSSTRRPRLSLTVACQSR